MPDEGENNARVECSGIEEAPPHTEETAGDEGYPRVEEIQDDGPPPVGELEITKGSPGDDDAGSESRPGVEEIIDDASPPDVLPGFEFGPPDEPSALSKLVLAAADDGGGPAVSAAGQQPTAPVRDKQSMMPPTYDRGGPAVDNESGSVNTEAAVLTVPYAVPVESGGDEPVYDAVQVLEPKETLTPCWRRRGLVVGSAAMFAVAIVVAVTVGSLLSSGVSNTDGERTSNTQLTPTPAPTLPPLPPINCTVEDLGGVYDMECWCTFGLARDGDTVVMVVSHSFGVTPTKVELFVGPIRVESTSLNHHIEEMAFSDTTFFASDPFSWDFPGGVVYAFPKEPSGGFSNESLAISPGEENIEYNAQFGMSMSVDGDVLVVGAPNDVKLAGSVFVYRRDDTNGTWREEAKLVPNNSSIQRFGNSVLIEGNVIIVAADQHGDMSEGAIYFYEYTHSSKEWQRLTSSTLVNEDCDGGFGGSLTFTGNGGLLIGCPMDDDARGAVYYYQRSGNPVRYNLLQKITANDRKALKKFGGNNHHFATNSNGDLVAIGTYDDASGMDQQVYLFGMFNNVWMQVARVEAPEKSLYFGSDVVITGDRLLVSSWDNSYSYKLNCM